MIGLVPQSMTLIKPTALDVTDWEVQLYQSWKNAAAVLDGLDDGGGKLEDCLGGLVYFSVRWGQWWAHTKRTNLVFLGKDSGKFHN